MRILTLAGSAIVAVTLGVTLQAWPIAALSLPIVIYTALASLLSPEPHIDLQVNRSLEASRIMEGESIKVQLTLRNLGRPLDWIEVYDSIPEEVQVTLGSNRHLLSLREGESITLTYHLSPIIFGRYTLGPLHLRCLDPIGFQCEGRRVEVYSEFRVLPQIQPMQRVTIKPKRTRTWPGEILSDKPGDGLEFHEIREYLHGDPLKRINWKASARFDKLVTNEFRRELGGDTIIVLDARLLSEVGEPPDSLLTHSIRATAIMAYRLLRDRNRVGVIVLGGTLQKIFPSFGRRQLNRILLSLIELRPGSVWEISNLKGYLTHFFSKMTQIIVISPLLDEKSIDVVREVAASGYQVMVLSPSPIAVERRSTPTTRMTEIAERLLRIRREARMDLLRRNATVIDWDPYSPLTLALKGASPVWQR